MKSPKFIIIFLLNILLMLLAIWLKPRFQTNDDIGMIYAYTGTAIFDAPTAVTGFSTKTFGLMMVFLYKILPSGIEVYTIVLFLLIFISSFFIHLKIFEGLSYKNRFFWLIFIGILSFITINFYLELQFTMVAGLLCLSGMLMFINLPKKREKIIGYSLFILSVLIRPSLIPILLAFLFLINFGMTFFVPLFVLSRKKIIKQFVVLSLMFCSVYILDKELHTSKEKQFLDFNLYRAGIVDFNVDQSDGKLISANWGNEELLLFKNWFYNDDILFNKNIDYKIERTKQHHSYFENLDLSKFYFIEIFQQAVQPIFRCILILSIILLFFVSNINKNILILFLVIIIYILFYNLLSIFLKVPPFRVSFLLFASGILLYIYFSIKMINVSTGNNLKFFFSGVFILYGLWITKISLVFRNQEILKKRCIENYNSSKMYIRWADYPFEIVDPFRVSESLKGLKIISMGAFSVHPAVINSFGDFKYNNLTEDIIGKDNFVSFLMPEDINIWQDFRMAYIAFVAKQYKRKVYFQKSENTAHCFNFTEFKLIESTDAKLD